MEKAPIFGKMVINILVNGKIEKGTWENNKFMYGEADKIN